MTSQKAVATSLLAFAATLLVNEVASFGRSCNFRCHVQPTLLDYMNPIGCYCHATCGGTLKCCADKSRYCGGGGLGGGGGGEQACMLPKKVRSATVVGGEKLFYRVGEAITYECPYHYELRGSATRRCIGKNIWTPGPPRCSYVTFVCSPPRIRDGDYQVKQKHYTTGDTISITCNPGYILEGSSTMRCSLNRWIELRPSCIRDRCSSITHCSKDAFCKNYQYYAKCICNDGFEGDGWICKRIPCYKHTCKSNEMCVDSGDSSGDYTCECKEGYMRGGNDCVVDPCFDNNCHENAGCSVVDGEAVCSCSDGFLGNGTYCQVDPCFDNNCHDNAGCSVVDGEAVCSCNDGFLGNGTYCQAMKCDPATVYGEEIKGLCLDCEDICCDATKLRDCRICIHMTCNGGEVCGEEGKSKVPTICSENECHENDNGFTVETPDYVHCLDDTGLQIPGSHCCWVGE